MDLTELLVDPTGVQTWRMGESELISPTTEFCQRIYELEALRLRMVHDVDTRGTAKTLGASRTAAWLSGATRMSPGTATGIVHLGRALTELADTAEALAAGRISTGHAKVVTGFFTHLPHGVPDEALPSCERYLLDAAAVDNPAELARRAAALRHMLEPVEGSVPDAENTELNELFATVVGGRGLLKATLDAESVEMLQSALSALAKPRPSEDGTPDPRNPARRRADALTEVLRRYLNSGEGPVEGAERPHLSLLIRAEDLAAAGEYGHGGCTSDGTEPDNAASPDDADADGVTDSEPEAAGVTPPRETDRGAYEAMFGTNPVAPDWMPWFGPLSAAGARRIACDCELTAIIVDDDGAPLNLGRKQRLVSPQQRRALVARDHGCSFPDCGRPASWTEAHHIVHWINGGTTDLVNLTLLCRAHHRIVHHGGWDIIMGADQHPWFQPPEWMDPLRKPSRLTTGSHRFGSPPHKCWRGTGTAPHCFSRTLPHSPIQATTSAPGR